MHDASEVEGIVPLEKRFKLSRIPILLAEHLTGRTRMGAILAGRTKVEWGQWRLLKRKRRAVNYSLADCPDALGLFFIVTGNEFA